MKAKTTFRSKTAKGKIRYFMSVFLMGLFPFLFTSCGKNFFCNGDGTLTVTNSSLHTVQRIVIGNTNYGTIDPGETVDIKLAEGTYKLKFVGISGGPGCASESEVIVKGCGKVGRQCSY